MGVANWSSPVAPGVSLANFGSTPSATGGSISGNTLTLQPADSTHPGGLSTGTQSIAGNKTFLGNVGVNGEVLVAGGTTPPNADPSTIFGMWAPSYMAYNFSAVAGYEFCALINNVYYDNDLRVNTTVDKTRPGRALNVIAGASADGFQMLHLDIGDVAGETVREDFGSSDTGMFRMPQGFGISTSISAPRMGVVQLFLGTATVSTAGVHSGCKIFLTYQGALSSPGFLTAGNINDSVSFDINSSNPADISNVSWLIVESI